MKTMDDWLSRAAYDERLRTYTSQRGEDRILQKLFEKIGVTNQWCVEFGAADGKHRSNTWFWITQRGWKSVQIEAARDYNLNLRTRERDSFEALAKRYKNTDRVVCLNRTVSAQGEDRLDVILSATPIPAAFDLLSIDVDGAEYDIWNSLQDYTPRVIVIEHNKTIPIEVSFHSDRGSSLRALVELGKDKGYELAAANDLNGIFVHQKEYTKLGIYDNSPEKLWHDHEKYRMTITENDDGTFSLQGENRLRWVRGYDGTLSGQLISGQFAWIRDDEHSLPSVSLLEPRRYMSGMIRHWLSFR